MAAYNLVLIEVTHPGSDQAAALYIVLQFMFEGVIIKPNKGNILPNRGFVWLVVK